MKGGIKCFLTIVDDYSRYVIVELQKSKKEATSRLQEAFLRLDRFVSQGVARVHSDRGGEFVSNELQLFFRARGIVWSDPAPNSPQSNGVAEHFNRTMLDLARPMLDQSRLPEMFCGYSMLCLLLRMFTILLLSHHLLAYCIIRRVFSLDRAYWAIVDTPNVDVDTDVHRPHPSRADKETHDRPR